VPSQSNSGDKGEDDDGDYGESDEDQDKMTSKFVETSPSGRFKRFDEELGRGAYKTVYRGVDHDTGREIAWSIICLARLPKSERPRIKSEIKIIKELDHPNIITFISAWICKEKEQIHFITEIITGGSLRQYLKKMGKPKLKVIKKWCQEILRGLSYLHSQQVPIIHRDIKCDNIFINSNSGEIKIGDLGLSTTMKNSYTSSVLGTPEFMAPELYEEYYGTEVDIYAFGMALLEMLTREAPYRECQNPAQIYRKVINREYPIALERVKNPEIKGFILECLDERSRRPTAKQLGESAFMMD
jgi:WNK lysine deficient protein kinase